MLAANGESHQHSFPLAFVLFLKTENASILHSKKTHKSENIRDLKRRVIKTFIRKRCSQVLENKGLASPPETVRWLMIESEKGFTCEITHTTVLCESPFFCHLAND